MKKLFLSLSILFMLATSCGVSDKYIQTNAYEWSVELKNGDVASGTVGTEAEAEKMIKRFSKHNDSKVKNKKIKTIKVKTKRSKL